jgi:hypothetical protein
MKKQTNKKSKITKKRRPAKGSTELSFAAGMLRPNLVVRGLYLAACDSIRTLEKVFELPNAETSEKLQVRSRVAPGIVFHKYGTKVCGQTLRFWGAETK